MPIPLSWREAAQLTALSNLLSPPPILPIPPSETITTSASALLFCVSRSLRAVNNPCSRDVESPEGLSLLISPLSHNLLDSLDISTNPFVISCPLLPNVITSTLASFKRLLSRRTTALDSISSKTRPTILLLCRVLGETSSIRTMFLPPLQLEGLDMTGRTLSLIHI